MHTNSYLTRRQQLTTYFDQTAAGAWKALTSNDPVNRIRATVRAGRDDMRDTLLGWLPDDLGGITVLDAGCGTGALAIAAAKRGAHVVAIDMAASLVDVARQRAETHEYDGTIEFRVGDMLADAPAESDYVIAMDSLIHYDADDVYSVVADFTTRAKHGVLFTNAPYTPALGLMHFVGRLIPQRENRAPAIQPVRTTSLRQRLRTNLGADGWSPGRHRRITSGFYISEATELARSCSA